MAELTDSLNQLLEGHADQISQRIDADEGQTRQAIQSAVPALLAALSADAERGDGLKQAIAQDHDGSIIDQLAEYLDGSAQLNPRTTNGSGILDHALGDRQEPMAQALSAKSGLDMSTIMRLLPLLAPIVMGMLGKRGKSSGGGGGTGGFSFDDIGDLLNREKQDARSKNPDIGDILDSFGKGSGAGSKSGGGIGDVLGGLFGDRGDR
ncbi:MAG TPA: DUF937 domain-containing protein [Candidatus Limnocylindria bacterium]|nr:DUF937 domain-containing protein [Candidatus Limnocylindria bacterium]